MSKLGNDVGPYAAARGFDALFADVGGCDYMTMYNRSGKICISLDITGRCKTRQYTILQSAASTWSRKCEDGTKDEKPKRAPEEGPNGVDRWTNNGYGMMLNGKPVEQMTEEQEIDEIEEVEE